MIDTLKIKGFRGFDSYELKGLSRVNLLVGGNNSGKTTVLEAVDIAAHQGSPMALYRCAMRRGEYDYEDESNNGPFVDLRHFFFKRNLEPENAFEIITSGDRTHNAKVQLVHLGTQRSLFEPEGSADRYEAFNEQFALKFHGNGVHPGDPVPVRELQRAFTHKFPNVNIDPSGSRRARFVSLDTNEMLRLAQLWDDMVLTEREGFVVESLNIIDPQIERVAFLGESRKRDPATAGVVVRKQGSERRLPIGSMGDGLKRLLSLSIHMASVPKGFLLVDEIDTGLHYSVMKEMWRLLIQTAVDLDIQVFATTHSLDCLRSLARLHEDKEGLARLASVHRLEPSVDHSIRHSSSELKKAIDHEMEVR